MQAHLPSHLGGVKIKGPGVSQAQHEILMAAQSGALAMASDSLRGHDVLGDDDQRETEVGFIAAVSLALSNEFSSTRCGSASAPHRCGL